MKLRTLLILVAALATLVTTAALSFAAYSTAQAQSEPPAFTGGDYARAYVNFQDINASFAVPPNTGTRISGEVVSVDAGAGQAAHNYILFSFDDYPVQSSCCTPQIRVYTVDDFRALVSDADERLRRLEVWTSGLQAKDPSAAAFIPDVPEVSASRVLTEAITPINFNGGRGIRFIASYTNGSGPVSTNDLSYVYLGLTADRQFIVAAVLPVRSTVLSPAPPVVAGELNTYNRNMARIIGQLSNHAFMPHLASIDKLMASLLIEEGHAVGRGTGGTPGMPRTGTQPDTGINPLTLIIALAILGAILLGVGFLLRRRGRASRAILLSLVLAATAFSSVGPNATAAPTAVPTFPDPNMRSTWEYTDLPVETGAAPRSWTWGPEVFFTGNEPYAQSPGGQHLVAYLDKARMEVNNPNGDRTSPWFVTTGLLVVEMMSGRIQVGDTQFTQVNPSNLPVAGEATSLNAPTFATLARFASLNGDNRAPNRSGQSVTETMAANGTIGQSTNLGQHAKYAVYDQTLGHNIPDVFWTFMNQQGTVYQNGSFVQGPVYNWSFVMGYPLTEPYWMMVRVGAEDRWVLVQTFQRRVLTYTPNNPPAFQVEMGNVGRSYYDWRYKENAQGGGPVPAPPIVTPVPTAVPPGPAAITINPTQGTLQNPIVVNGTNYPASTGIELRVERPDANYFRIVRTVQSNADGTFAATIELPSDAKDYQTLVIAATANQGQVRAEARYTITTTPYLTVAAYETVSNGTIGVQGGGFPPNAGVTVGVTPSGSNTLESTQQVTTAGDGTFSLRLPIGARPVGQQLLVVANGPNNTTANSGNRVFVIAPPTLTVVPATGPAGTNVSLRGTGWPANRALQVSLAGTRGTTQVTDVLNGVTTDGTGSLNLNVSLAPDYAAGSPVTFSANDPASGITGTTAYQVAANPVFNPSVTVTPNVLSVGQAATVQGTGYPPGAQVNLVLQANNVPQQSVNVAFADGNGNFQSSFTLSSQWGNSQTVTLVAGVSNGPTAQTTFNVVTSPVPPPTPTPLPPTVTPPIVIPPPPIDSNGDGLVNDSGSNMRVEAYNTNGALSAKVIGTGWAAGSTVSVQVASVGGEVEATVGNAQIDGSGTLSSQFDVNAQWFAHGNVGIRVTTANQYSIRHFPATQITRPNENVYNFRGSGWPVNTRVNITLNQATGSQSIGPITTDGRGNFVAEFALPKIAPGDKINLETPDGVYQTIFTY